MNLRSAELPDAAVPEIGLSSALGAAYDDSDDLDVSAVFAREPGIVAGNGARAYGQAVASQ